MKNLILKKLLPSSTLALFVSIGLIVLNPFKIGVVLAMIYLIIFGIALELDYKYMED